MKSQIAIGTGLAAFAGVLLLASGCTMQGGQDAGAEGDRHPYTEMSPNQLAEHLIFEPKGFAIEDATQEGGTLGDRLKQDELQKACSDVRGGEVSDATARKVERIARNSIEYPEGGIELGDWKDGQALAENAFGYRVGHKVDDHSAKTPGGLCINCHALEADKAHRSGTVGPSLVDYGDQRGRGQEALRYTYNQIYNPHASFPCTHMPRLGHNGILSKEQIQDVLAYLLDPESPVNR